MKTHHLLWIFLALAVAIYAFFTFGAGDEAKIREGFGEIAELISKQEGESALESADRARKLGRRFVDPFELVVDEAGVTVTDRASLVRPFVGLRHPAEWIDVSFSEIEVEVTGESAVAAARASVSGRLRGRTDRASWRVDTRWRKEGGDWLLVRFHVGERIEGGLF